MIIIVAIYDYDWNWEHTSKISSAFTAIGNGIQLLKHNS